MVDVNEKKLIEKITGDSVLYITLLNRELNQLNEHNMIKTFIWLKLIEEYKNPSISNLGQKINVSKSQMTSRIDSLVENGYITRVSDDVDRRIIRIKLTEHGHDFLDSTQKTLEADLDKLLSPLNLEEMLELETSVQTIKNIVLKIQNTNQKS
jgi:DNA-binding MarR family transcriptional regulator